MTVTRMLASMSVPMATTQQSKLRTPSEVRTLSSCASPQTACVTLSAMCCTFFLAVVEGENLMSERAELARDRPAEAAETDYQKGFHLLFSLLSTKLCVISADFLFFCSADHDIARGECQLGGSLRRRNTATPNVSTPTRPKYIITISMICETAESAGVSDMVRPTVPKAEAVSNRHRFIGTFSINEMAHAPPR